MVIDLCVSYGLALNHNVVVGMQDCLLLRRLRRLFLWLHFRVNNSQSLDVVIARKSSVQFRTGQLKGTIQIIGRFSVKVNQLSENLLIIMNRIRSYLWAKPIN